MPKRLSRQGRERESRPPLQFPRMHFATIIITNNNCSHPSGFSTASYIYLPILFISRAFYSFFLLNCHRKYRRMLFDWSKTFVYTTLVDRIRMQLSHPYLLHHQPCAVIAKLLFHLNSQAYHANNKMVCLLGQLITFCLPDYAISLGYFWMNSCVRRHFKRTS